ncbi:MAG TPA: M15 family metallopeptidase [Chloroflexota bacterium]|nr:M15 family metallopeptidase [Chloroflexota bacterium]
MTQTLKAAGGLAAATLALALLTSCASRPLATPAAPPVEPTPTPMPAPAFPARGAGRVLPPPRPPLPAARRLPASPEPGAGRVRLTAADGYIADGEGLSPFATDYPAVGNLAPELLAAVQHASTDAARDGVDLMITSGWRSVRYQQSLLNAAIAQYGSEAEARRWVNTPEKSTHVTGKAVDIGPTAAALWLRQRGNRYGLCQIYANEMWHYELATEPGGICPRPIANASAG